jgi:hypothetical protein
MSNLELVQKFIDKYDLKEKSRYRYQLDKRYFLFNILKNDGMSFSSIGRVFGLGHATVMNGLKNHRLWSSTSDPFYKKNIQELQEEFKHVHFIKTLKEVILECDSLEELEKIKQQILLKYY